MAGYVGTKSVVLSTDAAEVGGDATITGTVTAASFVGDGSALTGLPAGYTDGDVDTHVNTSTATTGQYLGWNGSDYVWETPTDTDTTYSAGGGLSLAGTTFSHTDTSSQASVNNSGNTVIQDITLDTYGHITGINSTTISSGPSTTAGAVGTYGYMHKSARGGTISPGTTIAGSSLRWSGTNPRTSSGESIYWWNQSATAPSGTWRCMGASSTGNAPNDYSVSTLFVRIS